MLPAADVAGSQHDESAACSGAALQLGRNMAGWTGGTSLLCQFLTGAYSAQLSLTAGVRPAAHCG